MHRKGIFHRDIKPENILIESTNDLGRGLKLADFGSCRGIYSKQVRLPGASWRATPCFLQSNNSVLPACTVQAPIAALICSSRGSRDRERVCGFFFISCRASLACGREVRTLRSSGIPLALAGPSQRSSPANARGRGTASHTVCIYTILQSLRHVIKNSSLCNQAVII